MILVVVKQVLIIAMLSSVSSCSEEMNNKKREVTGFCGSVKYGNSYEEIKLKAILIGEDQHRIIHEDFIVVGYSGSPPFPKKLCRIDFADGKVSETHSYGSK